MKKIGIGLLAFIAVLGMTFIGSSNERALDVVGLSPEAITWVGVSGSYNGGELEPWELEEPEIEALAAWLAQTSLRRRTYQEGKAPNEIWSGGASYRFDVNRGEQSFTWIFIDRAYIQSGGEWYEVLGVSAPPLNFAV